MAHVTISNLTKRFGSVVAVDDITLEIPDGKMTVLLGPSGCGKTTLMRLIAGLEETDAGEIMIGDETVTHVPVWDRRVAMVFQNYALYPHMNVFDNMAFPLRGAGVPAGDIKKRVTETARRLGIAHLLERKPRQLSGGQQQRVALGRAIVRKPRIFLMDEPLSNLDAALRVGTRTEIKRLQRDLNTTTLYVTHDQVEAMTLADTLVIMRQGRIQQIGAPQDIYDFPETIFVAEFLGSPAMNIMPANISNGLVYHDDVPLGSIDAVSQPTNILMGFRPESALLRSTHEDGIPVTITLVEPTGKEQIVSCRTNSGHDIKVITTERSWQTGDKSRIALVTGAIHIFDENTQQRIN